MLWGGYDAMTGEVDRRLRLRMGGGWGNAINWLNWEQRRVVGWKTPRPNKGDLIEAPMQSGRTAIFRITEIEYCYDPSDMFFATVTEVSAS